MGASSVWAVDWENDGDMDIVATAYEDDQVAIFENDGSDEPNFTPHLIATSFDGAWYVRSLDLDGDSDQDILAAAEDGDEISLWFRDGSWVFTQVVVSDDFDGANACVATDLDSDGDIDIVGVAKNLNRVSWFENNGNWEFTETVLTSDLLGARGLDIGDLDGDGDPDIVAGGGDNYDVGELRWWRNCINDPGPDFIEYTIDDINEGYKWVTIRDMNEDGIPDILTAAYASNRMMWWRNTINGSENEFELVEVEDLFIGATCINTGDIDLDGDLDVVGAAWYAEDIEWWENNGDDEYSRHLLASERPRARGAITVDIDGDGDLDVVSAVRGESGGGAGSVIEWYENSADPTPDPPLPFNLLSPEDGCTVATGDTTLTWEETTDPDLYDSITYVLWLATNNEFTENLDSVFLDSCSYYFAGMGDQQTWYWKVRAQDTNTAGTWSNEIWSMISTILYPPSNLVYELDSDSGSVELQWDHGTETRLSVPSELDELDDFIEYIVYRQSNEVGRSTEQTFTDILPEYGTYIYTVTALFDAGESQPTNPDTVEWIDTGIEDRMYTGVPSDWSIVATYPNPFNPNLVVVIGVPHGAELTIRVINILGREVALISRGNCDAGYHSFQFNASHLAGGMYFIHASVPGEMDETRKVFLLK